MENNLNLNQSNDILLDPFFRDFLQNMSKQMNFVGIMNIILGAIQCLSIIGAILGVPMIIAGLKLRDSVDKFQAYFYDEQLVTFKESINFIGQYFKMTRIYYIINIVLIAIVIVFYILLFAFLGDFIFDGEM